MSRENVELVRSLQPSPDVDLVTLFGDEDAASGVLDALEPFLHEDFVAGGEGIQFQQRPGLVGLRAGWADWLEPWESYRTEIEDVIDAGDDVVVLVRDHGRRPGMTAEISIRAAAIWTVREGKITRAIFSTDRAAVLDAVGLA